MVPDEPDFTAPQKSYHKSKTANATEAPTSGVTKTADDAAKNELLTEDEHDFVSLVDMHYKIHGDIFSAAVGLEKYSVPIATTERLLGREHVRKAIEERGISFRALDLTAPDGTLNWRANALSPEQLLTANVMMDLLDTRSEKKKLQDLGISTTKWQAWMRDPVFNRYLRDRGESLLGFTQHEAMLALADNVRRGDLKSIQYYHELTGRFIKQSSSGTGSDSGLLFDAKQLIQNIVTIIVDEVDDPEIAGRIAERMKGLIAARNVTNALMGDDDIIVPEIAAAPERSAEIQELMSKGVGMDN